MTMLEVSQAKDTMHTAEAPAPFAHYDMQPVHDSTIERFAPRSQGGFVLHADRPFTTEIFRVGETEHTVDVLARVTSTEADSTRLLLGRRQDTDELFFCKERPYGGTPLITDVTRLGTPESSDEAELRITDPLDLGGRSFQVSYAPKSRLAEVKLVGEGTFSKPATGEAHVQFASLTPDEEAAGNKLFHDFSEDALSGEGREHARKIRRRLAAFAVGLLGISAPHSLVDQSIDAFADQKAVVTDIAESDVYSPERMEAFESIEQLVDDIDAGREDEIQERADAFVELHTGDIATDEEVKEQLQQLESVETLEQLDQLMASILKEYGVSFSTSQTDEYARPLQQQDISIATEYAQEIIGTISLFPKSEFIDLFQVNKFVLTRDIDEGDGRKLEAAGMHTSDGIIYLDAQDSMVKSLIKPNGLVAHELTHAFHVGDEELQKDAGGFLGLPVDIAAGIGRYDTEPSFYGAIGDISRSGHTDEYRAEVGADLLTDGIIDPNESLRFESPVSEARIQILSAIESKLPGFADYLTSKTILSHENTLSERLGGKTRTGLTAFLTAAYFAFRRRPAVNRIRQSTPRT